MSHPEFDDVEYPLASSPSFRPFYLDFINKCGMTHVWTGGWEIEDQFWDEVLGAGARNAVRI